MTSSGSPCTSSARAPPMAPARLGLAVQSATWLWLQPGSGVGPALGGVDTAPCCPTEGTSTPLPGPCGPLGLAPSALHASHRHRARACGAQEEATWLCSQGTSAVSGQRTRCSGGGLALGLTSPDIWDNEQSASQCHKWPRHRVGHWRPLSAQSSEPLSHPSPPSRFAA